MAITPTYPGVYIEEIPSGVRTITGVSTSVTAFVGYTQRGPTDKATQIFSMSDYERNFGDLDKDSEVSYAIRQFFQNGGGEAWIVRVAKNAKKASISLRNNVVAAGIEVLKAEAISEGNWGNNVRLTVDWDTDNPDSLFNLSVAEYVEQNGKFKVARTEKLINLTMNSQASNYAVDVVKAGSDLIRLTRTAAAATAVATEHGESYSGVLTDADFSNLNDNHRRIAVTINGDGPHEFDLFDVGGSIAGSDVAAKLSQLAQKIRLTVENIKPIQAFDALVCRKVTGEDQIFARSGEDGEKASVHFSNASVNNATDILKLGVENGGTEIDGAAAIMPFVNGTIGGDSLDLTTLPAAANVNVRIKAAGVADEGPHAVTLWTGAANRPATFDELRECIKTALAGMALPPTNNAIAVLNEASVAFYDDRLLVVAGGSNPDVNLEFTNATGTTVADDLGLSAAGNAQVNIARYALGVGSTSLAQSTKVPGSDGTPPGAGELIGEKAKKTGLYALEDADIFNILSIPGTMNLADTDAAQVAAKATKYCEDRRAFYILDIPHKSKSRDTVSEVKTWLNDNGSLRHKNAALYFPRPFIADALSNYRLRAVAPSGTMAGLYARIDGQRGVWKAPAGTEAVLSGVQKIEYLLTDEENGALNPLAINCLRKFDVYGNVCWGGRTLDGADQKASEWKYIPVRRMALFIEETLYRGTKWVVFEPNDEPLWAQIRLNVGAFMHRLFRQGAFQGSTPRQAYFVKCDSETTPQTDINLGIVNIIVGFAPLKPAEFVIIKIQQMAGQIET